MRYRIYWTDRALSRMEEIGDYIASENPRAARRVMERILDRVEQLVELPRLGPQYAGANDPSLRQLIVEQYRVIYRIIEKREQIDILTVRHGKQRLSPAEID